MLVAPIGGAAHGRSSTWRVWSGSANRAAQQPVLRLQTFGVVSAAVGGAHRQGGAWVLTPDSWVVQW